MCRLFVGADAELWENQTRSLRMNGMVTSIRLENMFWSVLENIAKRDDMNVPQLLQRLYAEYLEEELDLGNFTSFLRVCCLRFIDLQLKQLLPSDRGEPIEALSSEQILELERQMNKLPPAHA